MATWLRTNGRADLFPAQGPTFTLAELQAAVGGYIEAIRLEHELWLFCNEDGKRLQLPVNNAATTLARRRLQVDDVIVGDCIVCSPLEAGAIDDEEG